MNSETSINLYNQIVQSLEEVLDPNIKNELLKIDKIETFDNKWKNLISNIEKYLRNITTHRHDLEQYLLYHYYFLYEDVAAIMLDLIWQKLNNKMDIKETLLFYKEYKIQLSNENLLTDQQN